MGRACDATSTGLRRHEQGKHVVFYRLKPDGIRIVRVLHQQMIPAKPHFEQ
jgi:plasmid stabilization system protein ParE